MKKTKTAKTDKQYKKPELEVIELDIDMVALTDCTGSSCPVI